MKLSEIKGDRAMDVLADIIEPIAKIMADKEVAKLYKSGKPKIILVKHIIKGHKEQIIEILAILEGVEVEEYRKQMNLLTLPMQLLDLLNDEEFVAVFQSQGQNMAQTSSGSAMVNTEVEEK